MNVRYAWKRFRFTRPIKALIADSVACVLPKDLGASLSTAGQLRASLLAAWGKPKRDVSFDPLTATAADAEALSITLRRLADLRRAIELHYSGVKEPIKAVRAQILEVERIDVTSIKTLEKAGDDHYKRWKARVEADAERQRREVQRELDEQARQQREAQVATLQRVAEDADTPEQKTALHAEAVALAAAPLPKASVEKAPAPIPAGIPSRKVYKARVVDADKLIDAIAANKAAYRRFFLANQSELNAWANEHEGASTLPGVEVEQDEILSKRRIS